MSSAAGPAVAPTPETDQDVHDTMRPLAASEQHAREEPRREAADRGRVAREDGRGAAQRRVQP